MLRLLGVPIDQVAEDYSLTRLHLEPIYARIRHDRQLWEFVGRLPSWTRDAAPETMAGFLQVIDHKYGSMRVYVTAHGLDTDVLNKLETALLTD